MSLTVCSHFGYNWYNKKNNLHTRQMKDLPKWAECTYCGIGANSLDHVVPISYTSAISRKFSKRCTKGVSYSKSKVVPACSECNNLLGNYAFHTIAERADYISSRLARRYEKVLNGAYWTEEDLDTVENNVKDFVIAMSVKKGIVLNRIRWARAISYMEFLEPSMVWASVEKGLPLLEFLGYH